MPKNLFLLAPAVAALMAALGLALSFPVYRSTFNELGTPALISARVVLVAPLLILLPLFVKGMHATYSQQRYAYLSAGGLLLLALALPTAALALGLIFVSAAPLLVNRDTQLIDTALQDSRKIAMSNTMKAIVALLGLVWVSSKVPDGTLFLAAVLSSLLLLIALALPLLTKRRLESAHLMKIILTNISIVPLAYIVIFLAKEHLGRKAVTNFDISAVTEQYAQAVRVMNSQVDNTEKYRRLGGIAAKAATIKNEAENRQVFWLPARRCSAAAAQDLPESIDTWRDVVAPGGGGSIRSAIDAEERLKKKFQECLALPENEKYAEVHVLNERIWLYGLLGIKFKANA